MQAVGAYLRVLRNDKKLTQIQAGYEAGISDRTVGRWEKGENEATMQLLRPLVRVVGGSMRDAVQLLGDERLDARAGDRKAREWLSLSLEERERILRIVAEEEDELASLMEELEQLAFGHENRIARLRGLADGWRADSQ